MCEITSNRVTIGPVKVIQILASMETVLIDTDQKQAVVNRTAECIQLLSDHFDRAFVPIPVLFDLRGKAAGMYRVRKNERCIRYNPHIFARFFDDNLEQTVPHEVAHYIADAVYGFGNIRPHGPEWKAMMKLFGANTRATCDYDLRGLPLRKQQFFGYRCQCMAHQLGIRRHNKVMRNQMRYFCKYCGSILVQQ